MYNSPRFHDDGYLQISGRIKELIITGAGKNIAPVPVEDEVKRELPDVVSNVVVIGDGKKYLTCLLTLKVVVDPATALPTDRLDVPLVEWCRSLGVEGLETVEHFRTSYQNKVIEKLSKTS